MISPLNWVILRFHVNFQECSHLLAIFFKSPAQHSFFGVVRLSRSPFQPPETKEHDGNGLYKEGNHKFPVS